MKTLDELLKEYEPERLAQIAKDDTPEAKARQELKSQAEKESEIRRGLRDANGDWIEQEEFEEDDEGED